MNKIIYIIFVHICISIYCNEGVISGCKNYYGINDDTGGNVYFYEPFICSIIAPNKDISHEFDDSTIPILNKLVIPYNKYYGNLKTLKIGPELPSRQAYAIVNISHNSFEGDLPSVLFITSETILKEIDFSYNLFTGNINSFFDNGDGLNVMQQVEIFNIRNNKFSGKIPDQLFNTMLFVKHLDLSNNEFTGCPKRVNILDETNFFCDMRGNNFDDDCDLTDLNCLIDEKHFNKVNITDTINTCPVNTKCTVNDEILNSLKIEGNLDIEDEIVINPELLLENDFVFQTEKNGQVNINNASVTVYVNDKIIENIKEGKMGSNLKLIQGNNIGNFNALNIKHVDSRKCVPLSSSINKDGSQGVFIILQPDEDKCKKDSYIIIYIFIGILGAIVIVIVSVMIALKFSQSFRDKVFPYNKRKNNQEQV